MHNGLQQYSHQNEVFLVGISISCMGNLLQTKQGRVGLFLFLPSAAGMLAGKCLM